MVTAVAVGKALDPWRCARCGRILARLALTPGSTIEVKCHSCHTISVRHEAA